MLNPTPLLLVLLASACGGALPSRVCEADTSGFLGEVEHVRLEVRYSSGGEYGATCFAVLDAGEVKGTRYSTEAPGCELLLDLDEPSGGVLDFSLRPAEALATYRDEGSPLNGRTVTLQCAEQDH